MRILTATLAAALVATSACGVKTKTAEPTSTERSAAAAQSTTSSTDPTLSADGTDTEAESTRPSTTEAESTESADAPAPTDQKKGAGEVGTRTNPIPIGQSADVGDGWTMKVNSVSLDGAAAVAAANEFNDAAPPGTTYVVINVTIAYDGPDESSSAGVQIAALGEGTNKKTDGLTQKNYAVPPEPALEPHAELFKGGESTGNVVLEVPTVDLPTLVLIGEGNFGFDDDARKFFAVS